MDLTAQILICVLVADLLTGLAHWWEDTYGLPSWPLLGPLVIEPNIEHHERPARFTMSTVLCRNYQQVALAATVCMVAWLCDALAWQLVLVALLAAIGNEVHSWAHRRPRSRVARLLIETRLVQSARQHAEHHRPPFDRAFCTLTNVVNPIADAVGLWRGLEWLVSGVGIHPKRCTRARRGV